jgi:hypothetical protein
VLDSAARGADHASIAETTGEASMKIARAALVLFAVGAIAATVTYAALPLSGRVLSNGELAGMKINGPDPVVTGASAWVANTRVPRSAQKAEITRLRKLGFVAGVYESLITNENRGGISGVQQFPSAKSASAQLAYESVANGPWTDFSVHGIPDARGFESINNSSSGRNVAFTDGDYYYIVGAGWSGGSTNAVSRGAVVAAALVLYHRVHGK